MEVITMDALVKRINLRLAHKGQQLKRPRGQSSRSNLQELRRLQRLQSLAPR